MNKYLLMRVLLEDGLVLGAGRRSDQVVHGGQQVDKLGQERVRIVHERFVLHSVYRKKK